MTPKEFNKIENNHYMDTIFGYWGLPLMICVISGIIFGIITGICCTIIWALMYGYSFIKFSDKVIR